MHEYMSPSLIQAFCESAVNTSHKLALSFFHFDSSLCELRRSFAKYIDLVEERENKKSIEIRVHKRGEKVTNIRINANAYMRLRKNISELCDIN